MTDLGVKALAVPMQDNDAHAETVRDYLKALLGNVWEEEEGFSGKRPFGNSGWQGEVYSALAKSGLLETDRFGEWDWREAESLVQEAIDSL